MATNSRKRFATLAAVVVGLTIFLGAFSCWPVAIPTILIGAAALLAQRGHPRWLWQITLPEWIMTWFVVVAVLLTVIGTFFRGPGWSWVWPWQQVPRG